MSRHNYSQYSSKKHNPDKNTNTFTEVDNENVVTPEISEGIDNVAEPVITTTAPEVEIDVPAPKSESVTGVVANCAKLNVRANPRSTADVVCVLDATTEVEVNVDNSTDEWVNVHTASGITGYCMRKFIDVNL